MARGDVVSDVQSIAAGANMDFQPGAGVEVMITEIGSNQYIGTTPNKVPDLTVALFDGTYLAIIRRGSEVADWRRPLKLFLNNTNYLRITNTAGVTASIGYTGVQTK